MNVLVQAGRGTLRGLTFAVHGMSLGLLLPVEAQLGTRLAACASSMSITPGVLDGLPAGPVLLALGVLLPAAWVVADLWAAYGHHAPSRRARNRHLGRFSADVALIGAVLGVSTLALCAISWAGLLGDVPIPAARAAGWSLQAGLLMLVLFGVPEMAGHLWSVASQEVEGSARLPGGRWWPWVRPWHLIVMVLPLDHLFSGHAMPWAAWAVALRLAVLRMDLLRHAGRRDRVSRWADDLRRHAPE